MVNNGLKWKILVIPYLLLKIGFCIAIFRIGLAAEFPYLSRYRIYSQISRYFQEYHFYIFAVLFTLESPKWPDSKYTNLRLIFLKLF